MSDIEAFAGLVDLASAAAHRYAGVKEEHLEGLPVILGVDVARFGDDRTALAKRRANVLLEPIQSWRGKDLMQTCGLIAEEYK